jgi:hypothetical protein
MISACGGGCYADYINLVGANSMSYVIRHPSWRTCNFSPQSNIALVRVRSLHFSLGGIVDWTGCRGDFATFQSYVEKAHSQFPVSCFPVCLVLVQLRMTLAIQNCHHGVRSSESFRRPRSSVRLRYPKFNRNSQTEVFVRCRVNFFKQVR